MSGHSPLLASGKPRRSPATKKGRCRLHGAQAVAPTLLKSRIAISSRASGQPHVRNWLQTNGVVMAKKGREWTKRDVRELTTLARQKAPAAKIAKSLKRTLGATRKKASELGVSLNSRG